MTFNDNDKRIFDRLESDFELVESMGYKVLGVFLQGSQNYGLQYEGSDIDTKAIVIPSFEDIVLNKKPVSTTHILPSNEHIDIKDIRLMFNCFRKQNINFIEILFTKYYAVSAKYVLQWKRLWDRREDIAHYDNYAAVNCIAGMVMEKHKALCHPYPSLVDKIEKYGYDNKQLHHIVRCAEFLERFISGESYEECLKPIDADYIRSIKSSYIYTLDEAKKLADTYLHTTGNMKDNYKLMVEHKVDESVDELLNSVVTEVIKIAILDDLGLHPIV